jgi:hypothetical protein
MSAATRLKRLSVRDSAANVGAGVAGSATTPCYILSIKLIFEMSMGLSASSGIFVMRHFSMTGK